MSVRTVMPAEFRSGAVPAGSKEKFLVHVGELASGSPLGIPVWVIAGTRPGPTVFVGAGVHGEEPAGMAAVAAVARRLDPREVKGRIVAVPIVNPGAWAFRGRHFPLDAPNVGDVASLPKGDAGGIMSERVVAAIVDHVTADVEMALDVHATHLDSINYPRAMVTITGAEPEDVQQKRLELGRAVGYELIHLWKRPGHGGGITGQLNRRGVPAIAIEAGEGWRALDPWVAILERGVTNFLKYAGCLAGELERPPVQVEVTARFEITANRGGMSFVKTRPGDFVREGQVVAEIRDGWGETIEELRSPWNGIIIRTSVLPTVASGARVCNVYQTDQTDFERWNQRTRPPLEAQIRIPGLPATR
jgi:predicted deacylase